MATSFTITPAVQQVINELEVQRKKIASNQLQGWAFIILGIIAFIVSANFDQIVVGFILAAAGIIAGAIKLYKISGEANHYQNRFKHEVIGAVLQIIDPSLQMDPTKGILEGEFKTSQLFTTEPDRYHSEDLVWGKTGKTGFYFAEVHAEYKTETQTKNGRRTDWHDILKGIIFSADFNKDFSGITVIRPKDFGSTIGAWFSKNIFSVGDKDVIQLENVNFNKEFITYGTDQIEARYILTPALMDRICELNSRSSQTVSLSFINSSMYIAFPLEKNYFEPPVFKTLLRPNLLDEDLSVLTFMYAIIEELDLNTRIWTKE